MKIATLTGATAYPNIEIAESLQYLIIGSDCTSVNDVRAGEYQLLIQSKNGQKNHEVCLYTPGNAFGEFVAQGEGFLPLRMDDNPVFTAAGLKGAFIIPVSPNGMYPLADGERFVLSIKGVDATDTLQVYAVPSLMKDNVLFKFEERLITAQRSIETFRNTEGISRLIVPQSWGNTKLEGLDISGKNGLQARFTSFELEVHTMKTNDIFAVKRVDNAGITETLYWGNGSYYVIDVENVAEVTFRLGGVDLDSGLKYWAQTLAIRG